MSGPAAPPALLWNAWPSGALAALCGVPGVWISDSPSGLRQPPGKGGGAPAGKHRGRTGKRLCGRERGPPPGTCGPGACGTRWPLKSCSTARPAHEERTWPCLDTCCGRAVLWPNDPFVCSVRGVTLHNNVVPGCSFCVHADGQRVPPTLSTGPALSPAVSPAVSPHPREALRPPRADLCTVNRRAWGRQVPRGHAAREAKVGSERGQREPPGVRGPVWAQGAGPWLPTPVLPESDPPLRPQVRNT